METRITLQPLEILTEVHLSKLKDKLNFRGIKSYGDLSDNESSELEIRRFFNIFWDRQNL